MKSKLAIEYDGAGAASPAGPAEPDGRTVQGELERVLHTILGDSGHNGAPLKLSVAGRTDAGSRMGRSPATPTRRSTRCA